MKFGVLGTGQVGTAISREMVKAGHDVVVGSRNPRGDKAEAFARQTGTRVAAYAEAAAHGEWVFNALPGEPAVDYLRECRIAGKILVDIANCDSAVDQPIVTPVGELIQSAFPDVRVVKALNSISARLMLAPGGLPAPHTVFVAGNDGDAKLEVSAFLKSFGWTDIVDLGDITASRAMEQLIPLWMHLEQALGGPEFSLSVVRKRT